MKYRSEIDGLRALAAIPVILFFACIKVSKCSLFRLNPLLKKLGLIVSSPFAKHTSLMCNETGVVCLQFTNKAKATFYSALPLPPSCIDFLGDQYTCILLK